MTFEFLVFVSLAMASSVCAKRTLTANFMSNITGFIQIEQENATSPSLLKIKLQGLNSQAGGYHIHYMSLSQGNSSHNHETCLETQGHYDPDGFGPCSNVNDTQCEEGDLSGRHGGLNGLNSIDIEYYDEFVTLFGWRSIVGRSIVIHHIDNGMRLACANLGYFSSLKERTIIFDGTQNSIEGKVTLRQSRLEEGEFSELTILTSLKYSSESQKQSSANHGFHVHENPVVSSICQSAGGHYNPTNQCTTSSCNYESKCDQSSQENCEAGDWSGRFGTISIASSDSDEIATLFTDTELLIYGPDSIEDKSIVIHDSDSSDRIACSNILHDTQQHTTTLTTVDSTAKISSSMSWTDTTTSTTSGLHGGAIAGISILILSLLSISALVLLRFKSNTTKPSTSDFKIGSYRDLESEA